MDPSTIAAAAEDLRARTIELLQSLRDEELQVEALPGWSVGDVFRHLAGDDRGAVLLRDLREFLPDRSAARMEAANDEAVAALRDADRDELVGLLDTWGRRMRAVVRLTPRPLARVRVPTIFGRVTLAWFATLRVYDEWVHQRDVCAALGRADPPMDRRTRELLAEFQLRALPAGPLRQLEQRRTVVEVEWRDLPGPPWRFDLWHRTFGVQVAQPPTVVVRTDVPTWNLVAADRLGWREAHDRGRLAIDGDDHAGAAALLDVVRVV